VPSRCRRILPKIVTIALFLNQATIKLGNQGLFGKVLSRMTDKSRHWPQELRLRDQGRSLRIAFDNGECFELTAEYLRVMSPSAEVQGHSAAERRLVAGKARVAIVKIDPVGNYAVRLSFDDSHNTGLYSWEYLYTLATEYRQKWAEYLAELAEKGMNRGADPRSL
jgi:DUF971 family protein